MSEGQALPAAVTFGREAFFSVAGGLLSPYHVMVVGAGGTGGRVASLLPRLVRSGDVISVVDPDIVEERNLLRQHFIAADVGRPKAEVVGERMVAAVPEGVEVKVYQRKLERIWVEREERGGYPLILLGCVDNNAARREMMEATQRHCYVSTLYVDAGNGRRSGQVVWTTEGWPVVKVTGVRGEVGGCVAIVHDGFALFPKLLEEEPETEVSCAARIDEQTVIANNDAAGCMGKLLAMILYGLPVTWGGISFSTVGGMVVAPLAGKVESNGLCYLTSTYVSVA